VVDGQSAQWDDEGSWEEEPVPAETEVDPEWQAYYDAIMAKPAWPVRVLSWTLSTLIALILGLAIMVQWGLWLALTMQLLNGWGGILGGLVAAVQIWLLFGTAQTKQSCEL
jgi:hypothetical protein